MGNKTKSFEEYELVHQFMFPTEQLKNWITEDSFVNIYKSDWVALMSLVLKIGEVKTSDKKYDNGERIYVESIYPRTFGMKNDEGNYMFRFNGFSCHYSLKLENAVYAAIIEVLTWLKEHKDENSRTNSPMGD